MNVKTLLLIAPFALLAYGCGDSSPALPPGGAPPRVSGTPEERIANIEADTTIPAEEKARRIAVVKERNGLK